MSQKDAVDFCNKVNLDDFNKIQPHGALIILNEELNILSYSKNILSLLNVSHEQLTKEKVSTFLLNHNHDEINNIEHYLRSNTYGYKKLLWDSNRSKTPIYAQAYHHNENIILNIERVDESDDEDDLSKIVQLAIACISDMSSYDNIESLSDHATECIKKMIGFDSVMIYQFDPTDYSGVVIGQSCEPDMHNYIGLHFPPNDVPKNVIDNYITQPLRYIPTILEEPVELVKCLAGKDEKLEIGTSPLRMVAPVHRQYLRNMDVSSATSIAILNNGKVWGLIACHSKGEKYLSINERMILTFISHSLSSTVHTLKYKKKFIAEQALLELQSDLTSSFSKTESLPDGLERYQKEFMKIMNASLS